MGGGGLDSVTMSMIGTYPERETSSCTTSLESKLHSSQSPTVNRILDNSRGNSIPSTRINITVHRNNCFTKRIHNEVITSADQQQFLNTVKSYSNTAMLLLAGVLINLKKNFYFIIAKNRSRMTTIPVGTGTGMHSVQ
jgi:hypothetical protein